jgi:lysozyme family protein
MIANRVRVMDFVYKDEGGFAIRALEPGGAVNMGISFARFEAWRKLKDPHKIVTFDDLRAMTREEATEIYAQFFFVPAHFDILPGGVDYSVLDPFINGGGLVILNRSLGFKDDHHPFGPDTVWAAKRRDPKALIEKIRDVRLARNKTLHNYNTPVSPTSSTTFARVWDRRTGLVCTRSLVLAGLEK